MCEISELEPLIVTSHDKGPKRGIALYFGINEINELEKNGLSLKEDRRFLVQLTTDNKLILIPFSNLDFLLNIEDKLDTIIDLDKEEKEEFTEELLAIISEKKVEIGNKERYSVFQFTKGHYTRYNIRNTIRVGLRVDKKATLNLIKKYIEKKRANKMIDEKLIEEFSYLSGNDKEDLRDELIDLIVEKNVDMSQQEKSAMFQFVKGHYNKNILSKVLYLVNKTDPNKIKQLSTTFLKDKTKISPPKPLKADINREELLNRIKTFSSTIQEDFVEDILSILSKDELKNLNLAPREKTDIFQLIKGHYNPARLFNAVQVAIRVLEDDKLQRVSAIAGRKNKSFKFGVELVPATGLDKLVEYSRKFEIGGIDNIWITDHYTNMDPYVSLTLIAKATSTAQLGVGVTNPYVRHLASTASSIASLDTLSDNRMILGIGAGDKSTLSALNIETGGALTTVSEAVEAIRLLWTEDTVNYTGKYVKIENARLSFRPNRNIPIYIGAQGPKMLKLAGEIGDGVLINASHELDFEIARKMILEGVKKSNRPINNIDVAAYTCFSISDDTDSAIKATIPVVTFIVAATPPNVLERHDLNVEKASKMKEFLARGNMAKAFQLVDNTFIDVFAIAGTPQQCMNKIENLKKTGVTQFVFGSPLGPKKGKAINLITGKILANYS
ncbi:MAG: 5,10-methylenetetrahydromethanopterin reductase [Candidatus Helarchaeota archaeon]|nr:5,10-methylenetetrahydromethanopterin reductase [Candidatus Helarchaeota archaeon]